MAASWPIQFTKGARPGVKRCQQSTEEDTILKKKDRSQYEKTVSTKDDDNMDSDESDFEYEQSEEMNYFFISKYAAEE